MRTYQELYDDLDKVEARAPEAEGAVAVSWDGVSWGITDEPWFRSCCGYQFAKRFFIVDTIGR